jgi:hypothetical protein
MRQTFKHTVNRIVAKSAVLDVTEGDRALARHFRDRFLSEECPPGLRIPVLIDGYLDGMGRKVAAGQEFTLTINEMHFDADYSVVSKDRLEAGFHFDLDGDTLERLDALAESCSKGGIGYLASVNYHGQGRVSVPSHWLRALVAAQRAQDPSLEAFYFHASEHVDAAGRFTKVALVSKPYWDKHAALEAKPLATLLEGRVPYEGNEVSDGVFIYRDEGIVEMRTALSDAGFRENETLAALPAAN